MEKFKKIVSGVTGVLEFLFGLLMTVLICLTLTVGLTLMVCGIATGAALAVACAVIFAIKVFALPIVGALSILLLLFICIWELWEVID